MRRKLKDLLLIKSQSIIHEMFTFISSGIFLLKCDLFVIEAIKHEIYEAGKVKFRVNSKTFPFANLPQHSEVFFWI